MKNKKDNYNGDEICIVDYSYMISSIEDDSEFFDKINKNEKLFSELPQNILNKDIYLDKDFMDKFSTYSNIGNYIKDINYRNSKNKLKYMSNTLLGKLFQKISQKEIDNSKISLFLGCMSADVAQDINVFLYKEYNNDIFFTENSKSSEISKYIKENKINKDLVKKSDFTYSIFSDIVSKYKIKGDIALIDTACSSSLTALDIAVNSLKSKESDIVLAGGIESNLSASAFSIFSNVGALSKVDYNPLDTESDGIVLGEGGCIFVLKRLSDCIRDKNKILAVINKIDGISDGDKSSFFSPSFFGQYKCLEKVYKDYNIKNLKYIECHATGTKIGDTIEKKVLVDFFKNNKNNIYIGSIKSIIGHTRSAAGAFSLLKSIFILENNIIPKNILIKNKNLAIGSKIKINKKPIILDKNKEISIGISSFGFGNINYHLIIERYNKNKYKNIIIKNENTTDDIAVIAREFTEVLELKDNINIFKNKFKISDNSMRLTDITHLLSLATFNKCIINIGNLQEKEKELFKIITCSNVKTNKMQEFSNIINLKSLKIDFIEDKKFNKLLNRYKHKYELEEINEDISFGTLSNVIADRISNFFNLNGKNLNIDAHNSSLPIAMKFASIELSKDNGLIGIFYTKEKYENNNIEIQGMYGIILSNKQYALDNNYPILEILKEIKK